MMKHLVRIAVFFALCLPAFAQPPQPPAGGGQQGDGIWLRNAFWGEFQTFDRCNGHQPGNGQYHHHIQPVCLRAQLDDNIEVVQNGRTGNIYREKSASLKHSPILGWSFDGYPVYGPYGYSDPNSASSPIVRMKSSFRLRTIANRSSLPTWALAHHRGLSESLQPSQYGPTINAEFPLGRYLEDFEFVGGSGHLDVYNGRFTVTPEFPNGTYAYFVTINDDGTPAFPYVMGAQYYGTVSGGAVNTVPAGTQDAFVNGAYVGAREGAPQLTSWFTGGSNENAKVGSGFDPSAGARTTWPFLVPAGAASSGSVATPTKADTQRVRYTGSGVYVNANGLGSYVMGPWFADGANGGVFQNWPSSQNVQALIPLAPAVATTKQNTGLGAIGLWVNGVAIFNGLDGASFSNATQADAGGGGVRKSSIHVSAASGEGGPAAPGSLMAGFALFGAQLGTLPSVATSPKWDTFLAGTTVSVRDSAGTVRAAEIYYASPSQIGYRVPEGTQSGFATVTASSNGTTTSGALNIVSAYPNAFQLSSDGLAQAYLSRGRGGVERAEEICSFANNRWSALPIDLGPASDQVFLMFYVTGLGTATNVTATIGGVNAPVIFAGPEGVYPGIEIVRVSIPRELAGRGKVFVTVTADGRSSNPVYISIK